MQFLLRALQLAAFLAVVHFNSVYQWTTNGYIVTALGVAAAFVIAAPFLLYAKVKWWLLGRRDGSAFTVVKPPLSVLDESAFRPLDGHIPPRLVGGKPRRGKGRRVPGFDGSSY